MFKKRCTLKNESAGFSLVELIIVIAIMAILVGVVASQVIPYLEKSRRAKDQQLLNNICTAAVNAIAESPVIVDSFSATDIESITNLTGSPDTRETKLKDNIEELLGCSSLKSYKSLIQSKYKSKAYRSTKDITITFDDAHNDKIIIVSTDDEKLSVSSE